jgi:hypothetical protein
VAGAIEEAEERRGTGRASSEFNRREPRGRPKAAKTSWACSRLARRVGFGEVEEGDRVAESVIELPPELVEPGALDRQRGRAR